ncbi:MAG TPA: hypothetical protein VGY53_05160 [Isosphaeraceae bacterium]|nr:hypothetical protein [Isosphaeraceae bacterium]
MLSALLVGYVGYLRVFAAVEVLLKPKWDYLVIPETDRVTLTRTAQAATELAESTFGKDHWSVNAPIRYYSSERGYWMYASTYKREREGKRVTFKPFALIWRSKDGKAIKTITADEAVADFDEPFDSAIKPGTKAGHVVHAQLTGNVQIHDDKGTPAKTNDDLKIALRWAEFDEHDLMIKSDSPVKIYDGDRVATGDGLQIDLRPHEGPGHSGFNGAKMIWLQRNGHIWIPNAGKAGILPGTNRSSPDKPEAPTPVEISCRDKVKIELPEPQPPPKAGEPPPPPLPTKVWFYRNVCVRRGTEKPDQLDCDELFLMFFPGPKTAPAPATAPGQADASANAVAAAQPDAQDDEAPLGGLVLRRAEATGHQVWLQSEAQDIRVRGNQFIHEKSASEGPDKTYFRADQGVLLLVEKIERVKAGPNAGQVQSIDTLRAIDATIFDEGGEQGHSTVVARGPGKIETRARRDGPVERTVKWDDQCVMRDVDEGGKVRRVITLTGNPMVDDPASGSLEARTMIVAWLRPKTPPSAAAATPSAPGAQQATVVASSTSAPASNQVATPASSADTLQIESMLALDDVKFTQEANASRPNAATRIMHVRKRFDGVFETPPPEAPPAPDATANAAAPASGTATASATTSSSGATPPTAAAPTSAAPDGAQPELAENNAEAKPAEQGVVIDAEQVWARILQRPGPAGGTEILEARLRNGFTFHEDPPPEKTKGTDLAGDKADLIGLGKGLYEFRTHGLPGTPARVTTDEFDIEGPILGLNQATDFAWVTGEGKLTQMVEKGMLNDGGLVETGMSKPVAAPAGALEPEKVAGAQGGANPADPDGKSVAGQKVPLVITWRSRMTFHGHTLGRLGGEPGAAKAEFFSDVTARTEDADLLCDYMEVFMDKTVSFARQKQTADVAEEEPKPQVALLHMRAPKPSRVVMVNVKRDPETRLLMEKQRIEGHEAWYNKVTGQFTVEGDGTVRMYSREGAQQTTAGPRLMPTSGAAPAPARDGSATGRAAATPAVASSNGRIANTAAPAQGTRPQQASAKTATRPGQAARPATARPLELTRVVFSERMKGRFGSGNDTSTAAPRQADFFGDVELLNGNVDGPEQDLDPDRPPPEYVYLSSQFLRVTSEPPPPGKQEAAHNYLNALYNASASTRDAQNAESAIQGDQITYDSFKDLFYVYSFPGREVRITQQSSPGQPRSDTSGESVMYNHRTGESQLNAPNSFRLFDKAKAVRAPDVKPEDPKAPPKPKRREPRLAPRGNMERRGFTGR